MRGLLLVTLFAFALAAHGDTCVTSGKPRTVLSANEEWRLIATPVETRAGAYTRAELYRKRSGRWRRNARWRFLNARGPMRAIVADDGTVVTFDNECSYGAGRDVVVIYRPDGAPVRSLALADLLVPEDLTLLPRTVSSIPWSGTHRLEEEAERLVLQVEGPPRPVELPVSLRTGELLVPKQRRFHVPEFDLTVTAGPEAGEDPAAVSCRGGIAVRGAELLSRASALEMPPFPPVAQKARVEGDVALDLTVDETGAVSEVAVRKPFPFGLSEAAAAAARQWRFHPLEREGTRVTMCGRVVVRFARIRRRPPVVD